MKSGAVAVVGRANAGKSTLINCLADHKNLAFVSKRPGQTKLLNYFFNFWANLDC